MSITRQQSVDAFSPNLILDLANRVVWKYVERKSIPLREREDVVMFIVEKFLTQKESIISSFKGQSKLTTYFIAILNRMCCEIIRKDQRAWYQVSECLDITQPQDISLSVEAEKSTLFKNEHKRLTETLLFFNGNRHKTTLFIKYYLQLEITEQDIEQYCKEKANDVRAILMDQKPLSKAQRYEQLANVVSIVEGKCIKGDAVRMWLQKQIDTVLCRLNGNGISNHTIESLEVLMTMEPERASSDY